MNNMPQSGFPVGKTGSYIITGPSERSIEKEADALIMRAFCDTSKACGSCGGCKKYLRKSHADVLHISPKGATIKIDDVREIPAFLWGKAYEGGIKAAVIHGAQAMTPQAQNALLKILEEPPPHALITLLCTDTKNLLPTILSRCIILKARGDIDVPQQQLMETYSLPTLKARALLGAADGDYYQAELFFKAGYFDIREDMLLLAGKILQAKSKATSAMEKLLLSHEDALDLALRCLSLLFCDLLFAKHGGAIVNEDIRQQLYALSAVSDYRIVNAMEKINELIERRRQCAGLNVKLAVQSALLCILEVIT